MQRRTDVLWRSASGFLALSREGQDVTVIQGPAADVWELLSERISLDELSDALASRYRARSAEVRADIEQLVGLLSEQGYVEAPDLV